MVQRATYTKRKCNAYQQRAPPRCTWIHARWTSSLGRGAWTPRWPSWRASPCIGRIPDPGWSAVSCAALSCRSASRRLCSTPGSLPCNAHVTQAQWRITFDRLAIIDWFMVKDNTTYLGTMTRSVARYSLSRMKCSFLTRSARFRVSKLPLRDKKKLSVENITERTIEWKI